MDIKCPHCGTECDAEENECGSVMKCEICGKEFVVGHSFTKKLGEATAAMKDAARIAAHSVCEKARNIDWKAQGDRAKEMAGSAYDKGKTWYISIWRAKAFHALRLMAKDNNLVVGILSTFKYKPKPYLAICPKCRAEHVKWASFKWGADENHAISYCQRCNHFFRLRDGIQRHCKHYAPIIAVAKRAIEDIDRKLISVNQQIEVVNTRSNFQEQSLLFEEEWEVCQNAIIGDRLKFLIEGLRTRLSSVNFEKVVNAQHATTVSNVAYGTTIGLRDPQSLIYGIARDLVQLNAFCKLNSIASERDAIYGSAKELEEKLIHYERMMDHYYELQLEFHGKQKDDAKQARLLARCERSDPASLPLINPELPSNEKKLAALKERLSVRRKTLMATVSHNNDLLDKASERIGVMSRWILAMLLIAMLLLLLLVVGK